MLLLFEGSFFFWVDGFLEGNFRVLEGVYRLLDFLSLLWGEKSSSSSDNLTGLNVSSSLSSISKSSRSSKSIRLKENFFPGETEGARRFLLFVRGVGGPG
uniref:Uncharacterized protein n=1 Tax=Lepeophtheirus salmonis TaxID=72036 RepID=A0A0K2TFA2_LEPSM